MTPIILFYIFATILLVSGLMVVLAKNPVHAALFLILAFCNAAGLFLLAGAEFLAILLIAIYAGAVMILFLFIVMTMQTNLIQLKQGLRHHALAGFIVTFLLIGELIIVSLNWQPHFNSTKIYLNDLHTGSNTQDLGSLIYTHYVLLFQISGLILLVAMIGAIILTLQKRPNNRRQNIDKQHQRKPTQTLELRSLKLGQGTNQLGGFIRPKTSYYETNHSESYGPQPGDKTDITQKMQDMEHLK